MQSPPFPIRREDNSTPSHLESFSGTTERPPNQKNTQCRCHSCGCDSSHRDRDHGSRRRLIAATPMYLFSEADMDDFLSDAIASQEGVEGHWEQSSPTYHDCTPMERWQHSTHEDAFSAFSMADENADSSPLLAAYSHARVDSPVSMMNEPADPGSLNHSIMSLPPRRPSEDFGLLEYFGAVFDEFSTRNGGCRVGPVGFHAAPLRLSPEDHCSISKPGRKGSGEGRGGQ